MKRKIVKSILHATQETLEGWFKSVDRAVELKLGELEEYERKKQQIIPKLLEGYEKGLSTRELAKIFGIPHQTIARWIKQTREKQDAERKETV